MNQTKPSVTDRLAVLPNIFPLFKYFFGDFYKKITALIIGFISFDLRSLDKGC